MRKKTMRMRQCTHSELRPRFRRRRMTQKVCKQQKRELTATMPASLQIQTARGLHTDDRRHPRDAVQRDGCARAELCRDGCSWDVCSRIAAAAAARMLADDTIMWRSALGRRAGGRSTPAVMTSAQGTCRSSGTRKRNCMQTRIAGSSAELLLSTLVREIRDRATTSETTIIDMAQSWANRAGNRKAVRLRFRRTAGVAERCVGSYRWQAVLRSTDPRWQCKVGREPRRQLS